MLWQTGGIEKCPCTTRETQSSGLILFSGGAGMEPFTKAPEVVARVMRDGARQNTLMMTGVGRSPEYF